MSILVTGGGGYIGSHTIVELLKTNRDVIVLDNLVNCYARANDKPEVIKRVETITGKSIRAFYNVDIGDRNGLDRVFKTHKIQAVIHFAALKAVGESCRIPLLYYQNNITGTCTLLEVMKENHVTNLLFSSSATVYGDPQALPITEQHPTGQNLTNPYGRTKYFIEQILKDVVAADESWNVISLRYFNPVGAHVSGQIGEDPNGIPNNLMPYISQVAVGRREKLQVFGNDYPTADGTGVRDYLHIYDLAVGHIRALEKLLTTERSGRFVAYNLGTGRGYSVLEVIKAFEKASGKQIAYEIVARRAGDVAAMYADASLAASELNWRAQMDLLDMCRDTWRWQSANPNGFNADV